jgi:hypothetical protein
MFFYTCVLNVGSFAPLSWQLLYGLERADHRVLEKLKTPPRPGHPSSSATHWRAFPDFTKKKWTDNRKSNVKSTPVDANQLK